MIKQLGPEAYIDILRRRKWVLIAPTIACAILAYAISYFVPARYTSQTLVLVEGQKVSESLVKPAVTEDLNQRLSTMKEQILSRSRLEPIMTKFGLYKEELSSRSKEDLLDDMRKQITVTPIHGNNDATTGFFIAFTASKPKLAQDICSEITSLFMEENLKIREDRAVGTTDFLESQLQQAKQDLDHQDAKLAAFQRKYMGKLPEQEPLNVQMLTTSSAQLDGVTEALSRALQEKGYLQSQITQQQALIRASDTAEGKLPVALQSSELEHQLQKLRSDLANLELRYTPDHPDVVRTKRMIASVEQQLAQENASNARTDTLNSASPQTKAAASLSAGLHEDPSTAAAIDALRANLHAVEAVIKDKSEEQLRLQKTIRDYEERVQLSPSVAEQYKELTRDYQSAQAFYDDLLNKRSQSEMATDLERRQQGEQFRIVDPANLPDRPSFPNRELFGAGGLVLGLVVGAGIAFLLEIMLEAFQSEKDVERYLKLPLLACVPALPEIPENDALSRTFSVRWWQRGMGAVRKTAVGGPL